MVARLVGVCVLLVAWVRAAPAAPADPLVFAAISLTDVLTEVGRLYREKTGHRIVFNFGGTHELVRQIRAGAPADVIFSADAAHVEDLIAAGLVAPDARQDVLSNALVVIVPRGTSIPVARPEDLLHRSRIAIANPESVPAGIYARTWLTRLDLWQRIQPALVPTLDVRATLAAVAAGNADAGIVYRTDAAASAAVTVAYEVPGTAGPSIVYPLAALAASTNPLTPTVVRHLTSEEARVIYERFGFIVLAGR